MIIDENERVHPFHGKAISARYKIMDPEPVAHPVRLRRLHDQFGFPGFHIIDVCCDFDFMSKLIIIKKQTSVRKVLANLF
jgi:hypothetical protein